MTFTEIGHWRLANQMISAPACKRPEEVVAALGAMQAQDFAGALWAIGLRLPSATEASVEQAIAERRIVRTWPMRGTLHLVAATDIHWMLDLMPPRVITNARKRAEALELDAKIFARCEKLFLRELGGDRQLTREAMMELLEQNKISTASQRGYHILWRLAQEKVICFGTRSGKQHTFALLHEWVAAPKKLERAVALVEIAERYFTNHGPVTLQDFIGWTGLTAGDARAGLESAAPRLEKEKIEGKEYWFPRTLTKTAPVTADGFLLPGFDEFILGYKDRNAVLEAKHAQKIIPGNNGMFMPSIILNGRVAGTWKRTVKKSVTIIADGFKRFDKVEMAALQPAAERYGKFLGMPVKI
ncbi:MAG TPA: winged helix DNA-binding domain-containing protein [Verrucomicrobiae bacterium]|nr:winged helix DNA-binding domain-containing protein [Verrucomicrobiae bacterium]